MKRVKSFNTDKPILYLVATPIGNLSDITFRAIEVLKSVDLILAEDTRNSLVLLNHFNINTRMESYHEFNQDTKTDKVIEYLNQGKTLALISDAGLPLISDPGYKLVRDVIKLDYPVVTIPGASAGISALIASGLVTLPYTFYGFLDSKENARTKELEELKYINHTIIFYEAPHRIKATLKNISDVFGNREIVIARELTKKFEEYIRGRVDELLLIDDFKGELVLIVEGFKEIVSYNDNLNEKIDELIKLGNKPQDAIKEVARMYNKNKKEVYSSYVKYKQEKE